MPYPLRLGPYTLDEIERRHLLGESLRALAQEHGVTEGALRKHLGPHHSRTRAQVWATAWKIADARQALLALPPAQQREARRLEDEAKRAARCPHCGR